MNIRLNPRKEGALLIPARPSAVSERLIWCQTVAQLNREGGRREGGDGEEGLARNIRHRGTLAQLSPRWNLVERGSGLARPHPE